jgi:hypothetical protein
MARCCSEYNRRKTKYNNNKIHKEKNNITLKKKIYQSQKKQTVSSAPSVSSVPATLTSNIQMTWQSNHFGVPCGEGMYYLSCIQCMELWRKKMM